MQLLSLQKTATFRNTIIPGRLTCMVSMVQCTSVNYKSTCTCTCSSYINCFLVHNYSYTYTYSCMQVHYIIYVYVVAYAYTQCKHSYSIPGITCFEYWTKACSNYIYIYNICTNRNTSLHILYSVHTYLYRMITVATKEALYEGNATSCYNSIITNDNYQMG